ncbi:uncharacterized protein BCR38DRAFT_476408 [Pseudomassariella vexata]|uniref:Glucose-methanol-choline oxidoreductase N-terminal domain-containing protein n=1 Tax=Pseudomassariella vexata TaxID=1141098 RepID=A0A1Y2DRD5_9PEZI|nr:uncharacterized protein BCR38DRAFT_476408 [Pseudomassariella vexata]ORY61749.1 hypothetical protein BCR38DRAFT_476408 [Pseudomassariella vexata]
MWPFDASRRNRWLRRRFPIETDLNCPTGPASGYFYLDYTIDEDGYRHSAYKAYLPKEVALARQARLTVCTGVVASRLELDVDRRIATGVYIKPAGSRREVEFIVKARREVIICSGAIGSPQLLMLSGIGNAAHLKSQGIAVKHNLPGVGTHLSDHHGFPIMMQLPMAESLHRMETSWWYAVWQIVLFIWNRTGWMKSGTTTSTIYINTLNLDPETSTFSPGPGDPELDGSLPENIPDLEIMVIPAGAIVGKNPGLPLFTLYACLIQPSAHGSIELASRDPEESPKVHYKVLEDAHDLVVTRRALRFTLNLAEHFMETSGYQHPVKLFHAPNADTGRSWRDLDDDQLDSFARGCIQSVLHLGCSCRMANEENGGVVDDQLRVYGFSNLRIADASIFPKIPAAHTMAPVYMVAERCAQFVKSAWATV